MGCCLTTPTTTTAGDNHHHHHHSKPTSKPHGGPPPPPPAPVPEEEETVKEVLSETPLKPPPPPSNSSGEKQHNHLHPQNDVVVRFTKTPIGENEVSSEMYTYSESFSNATTTTTTTTSFAKDLKRSEIGIGIDEDGEVTQKVKIRPPARKQPMTSFSGESARRKERGIRPPAPARRSTIPSTDKKIQIPARNLTTQRHRNVVPSNSGRRESPARISRSPAIRKVKEKSHVLKSGDRIPVNVTENKGNFKLKTNSVAGMLPEPAPVPEMETLESLENPLVSLECFIFL